MAQQGTSPPASQPETPAFPGQVEQVTVDVVVQDENGIPLRGLVAEDLEIYEDGVRQTVVSFEAVHVPPAPAASPKPRPKVSTNQEQEDSRGRTFVLLFDDNHLSPSVARQAKAAVAEFLGQNVREGDQVTLLASSGNAWWSTRMEAGRDELIALVSRLEGLHLTDTSRERMTAYEAMRIHLRRDSEVALRVQRRFEQFGVILPVDPQQGLYRSGDLNFTGIDPYIAQKAAVVYYQTNPRNRMTLDALERSLEALNATRGRKSLILISEGFIYDPKLEGEFKQVIKALRRANTVIYFVNARGLEGMPELMTAQFGPPLPGRDQGFIFSEDLQRAEGADALASESGGFTVRNTNDLAGGFARIAQENSSYYLVGYNPTNLARDGVFREISVELPGRKGIEIRARKGYYAPSDGEDAERKRGVDAVFQEALDSPYELGDIPLRMTHFVGAEALTGTARVKVATEVDVGALDLEERGDRFVGGIEFVLVAASRETGEYSRYDQKVELKLLAASRAQMMKTGFPLRREFELAPGGYKAKIAVRDIRSGRVGTVVHEFTVPELAGFRVSTPVLTNIRPEEGEGPGATLLARRAFEPGQEVFCQFEVYGAQKDSSGLPRVVMGYAVRRADGSFLTRVEPTGIRPTSIGHLTRFIGLGVGEAQAGDYELVMAFRDMLSGDFLEAKESFSISDRGSVPVPASTEP
jgi:VWFA-related protein